MKIIAPVIEWNMKSRDDEIKFAEQHKIDVTASVSSPYSIDTNIWGTSIECGILDDFTTPPPDDIYLLTKSAVGATDRPIEITIGF